MYTRRGYVTGSIDQSDDGSQYVRVRRVQALRFARLQISNVCYAAANCSHAACDQSKRYVPFQIVDAKNVFSLIFFSTGYVQS